jgi:hypothetical protein
MNYQDLNKNEIIKSTISHLAGKFGANKFKVKDNWYEDLNAIGLTDDLEKYLIYFSNYGQNLNDFYVSLENLTPNHEYPYEPAGDFYHVDIKELEELFIKHLKIQTVNM